MVQTLGESLHQSEHRIQRRYTAFRGQTPATGFFFKQQSNINGAPRKLLPNECDIIRVQLLALVF